MNKISCPVLLVHSVEDDMVSQKNSEIVYSAISSDTKKYIELVDSYHLIVMDKEKETVFRECVAFVKDLD